MDILWERSVPFFAVDKQTVCDIIREYDKACAVLDIRPISMGCRNSNYAVLTDRRKLLLRVCPPEEDTSAKELLLFNELKNYVSMPEILHVSSRNSTGRTCLLYHYIDGVPLNKAIADRGGAADRVVLQAARYAACIHRYSKPLGAEFHTFDLPPFLEWYDLFLNNSRVADRLGQHLVSRVRGFMQRKGNELLGQIHSMHSLTHGDYRPANMLLDEKGNVSVVDWEYAGRGHTLADIGQFFRYRQFFDRKQRKLFRQEYDLNAAVGLPENWYSLCRVRDLVNPLQMLDSVDDQQYKHQDLISVIHDIINETED